LDGEEQTMTDVVTKQPLRVSGEGTLWPYIRLPDSQVEEVSRLLTSHGIRYSVQESILSMDGGPFIAVIDLPRGSDPKPVQTILDSELPVH
jgi:hypothetical protein